MAQSGPVDEQSAAQVREDDRQGDVLADGAEAVAAVSSADDDSFALSWSDIEKMRELGIVNANHPDSRFRFFDQKSFRDVLDLTRRTCVDLDKPVGVSIVNLAGDAVLEKEITFLNHEKKEKEADVGTLIARLEAD